jgi:hypothetical protein
VAADTKYVKLIVVDADGDTDSNKQSFPVSLIGRPKVFGLAEDVVAHPALKAPKHLVAGKRVTLDATRSVGNAPLKCTWRFTSRGGKVLKTLKGCKVRTKFKAAGKQYLRLTVRDADGDTASIRRVLTVRRG